MARHVTFDYERVLTPIGFVWVPVARVKQRHGRNALELDMTVDSGVDLTMLRVCSTINRPSAVSRSVPLNSDSLFCPPMSASVFVGGRAVDDPGRVPPDPG